MQGFMNNPQLYVFRTYRAERRFVVCVGLSFTPTGFNGVRNVYEDIVAIIFRS